MKAIRKLVEELKTGKSVREIISQTSPEEIQNLQCIESQMAIISVIAKLGCHSISQEVIFDQLRQERIGLMNTVGSKSMVKFLEYSAATTQEVLASFSSEDFKPEQIQERVADILSTALQVNEAQVVVLGRCQHTQPLPLSLSFSHFYVLYLLLSQYYYYSIYYICNNRGCSNQKEMLLEREKLL